ncbi:MAG: hydrogenase maturation protease [Anaerolineaceae bacterium]|nr:hydrogenase maturation protease [Anaerolineaceae bacterium]
MKATLILGYGNFDRQDDGVAWHILEKVAKLINRSLPEQIEDTFIDLGENPDLLFNLQLVPEMADIVKDYERVCFVDAHTGAVENDVNISPVNACFQNSPFTHHMTPETLLCFVDTLYQKNPEALLVSVRGYDFNFERSLSEKTEKLAEQAGQQIIEWLRE